MGCVYLNSYAQQGVVTVKGEVLTDDHTTAEGTTATLLKAADSSEVRSSVCNQQGDFVINGLQPGSYLLYVHKIGYKRYYSGRFTVNKLFDFGKITLKSLTNELNEVNVTERRNFIEVRPDKTVLNVDKSILATGNSALDILSMAPGVRILGNQVLMKGGQRALVAVDGKPIGVLSDDQLTDLLKSYQSSAISQIELIQNPGAKYDAAGGGGVINIILKKSKDLGFKATLFGNAGVGQDYKFSTGINANYRTKKFNFFGNYSFSDNKTPRELDIDRNIADQQFDLNYKSTTYLKNHNFNFGTDYSITDNQTVGFLVYGYHNDYDIDKTNNTDIYTSHVIDSNIAAQSHIDRDITNINYNLNYRGAFGKERKTELSADFDYSTYDRGSAELLENTFFFPDGKPYQDPLYYIDNSPSNIRVRSEKIDIVQPISKVSTLSAGIKNSQVNSDNRIEFSQSGSPDTGFKQISALSDNFEYHERINSTYVNYLGTFKNTTLSVGLRAEQTSSSAESHHPDYTYPQNYFNLFPSLALTQNLDKDNSLTFDYARRITRPNYQDLNPFVAFIDQYSYSTGNPLLKPELTSSYSVAELYKQKYKVTLTMTVTSNYTTPVFIQNDSTKVYTTTSQNLGTEYVYESEFNVPFDITKWWRADLYLDFAYSRYKYNSGNPSATSFENQTRLNQHFTITKTLQADLFGAYDSPLFQGIKHYDSQWTVRAGLSQSVFDNRGSIRLAMSDIFNSDVYKYTSHYLNLDLTGREKPGTRFLIATFIYRLGKQSVKTTRSRVGGNLEEQNRLGGSNNEK